MAQEFRQSLGGAVAGHNSRYNAFWQNAELVLPPSKERITLRLDREVLAYFRRSGSGYQTRINAVLRAYVQTQKWKKAQP